MKESEVIKVAKDLLISNHLDSVRVERESWLEESFYIPAQWAGSYWDPEYSREPDEPKKWTGPLHWVGGWRTYGSLDEPEEDSLFNMLVEKSYAEQVEACTSIDEMVDIEGMDTEEERDFLYSIIDHLVAKG